MSSFWKRLTQIPNDNLPGNHSSEVRKPPPTPSDKTKKRVKERRRVPPKKFSKENRNHSPSVKNNDGKNVLKVLSDRMESGKHKRKLHNEKKEDDPKKKSFKKSRTNNGENEEEGEEVVNAQNVDPKEKDETNNEIHVEQSNNIESNHIEEENENSVPVAGEHITNDQGDKEKKEEKIENIKMVENKGEPEGQCDDLETENDEEEQQEKDTEDSIDTNGKMDDVVNTSSSPRKSKKKVQKNPRVNQVKSVNLIKDDMGYNDLILTSESKSIISSAAVHFGTNLMKSAKSIAQNNSHSTILLKDVMASIICNVPSLDITSKILMLSNKSVENYEKSLKESLEKKPKDGTQSKPISLENRSGLLIKVSNVKNLSKRFGSINMYACIFISSAMEIIIREIIQKCVSLLIQNAQDEEGIHSSKIRFTLNPYDINLVLKRVVRTQDVIEMAYDHPLFHHRIQKLNGDNIKLESHNDKDDDKILSKSKKKKTSNEVDDAIQEENDIDVVGEEDNESEREEDQEEQDTQHEETQEVELKKVVKKSKRDTTVLKSHRKNLLTPSETIFFMSQANVFPILFRDFKIPDGRTISNIRLDIIPERMRRKSQKIISKSIGKDLLGSSVYMRFLKYIAGTFIHSEKASSWLLRNRK